MKIENAITSDRCKPLNLFALFGKDRFALAVALIATSLLIGSTQAQARTQPQSQLATRDALGVPLASLVEHPFQGSIEFSPFYLVGLDAKVQGPYAFCKALDNRVNAIEAAKLKETLRERQVVRLEVSGRVADKDLSVECVGKVTVVNSPYLLQDILNHSFRSAFGFFNVNEMIANSNPCVSKAVRENEYWMCKRSTQFQEAFLKAR